VINLLLTTNGKCFRRGRVRFFIIEISGAQSFGSPLNCAAAALSFSFPLLICYFFYKISRDRSPENKGVVSGYSRFQYQGKKNIVVKLSYSNIKQTPTGDKMIWFRFKLLEGISSRV